MEWCLDRVIAGDLEFDDVIWTDECSVQLESHRKITYHKQGQPLTKKCLKRACAHACTVYDCLLYTSPSPRDATLSRMPSSA